MTWVVFQPWYVYRSGAKQENQGWRDEEHLAIVPTAIFLGGPNMLCRDCVRFDAESERCLDRKVNPQRWETAVNVAQVIGLRSICVFNEHRERLIACRKTDPPARA
jgi:hypothetical protein